MGIGNAVERGSLVYIYDEKGRQTATVSKGSGANDGLKGYWAAEQVQEHCLSLSKLHKRKTLKY